MADAPAPTPVAEQTPAAEQAAAVEPTTALEPTPAVEPVTAVEQAAAVEQPTSVSEEPVVVQGDISSEAAPAAASEEAPAAAPEPVAAPAASTGDSNSPSLASTVEVPASTHVAPAAGSEEGGEWDLLMQKLNGWIQSGQLQQQWQALRTPLSLVAGLIGLLVVLQVYGAVLAVLDSIPVFSGLLELAGLITVVRFSTTRLVRSDDRRQVINGVRQRWQSFRGRN